MIKIDVKLKGMASSLRAIDELADKVKRDGQRKALDKAVRPFQAAMKRNLKVKRTGLTRKSITGARARKIVTDKRKGIVFAVVGPSRAVYGENPDGSPHRPANIAHIIEGGRKEVVAKGTKVLSRGAGRMVIGKRAAAVKARPFIGPAEKSTRSEVKREYENFIGPFTEKAAAKIGKRYKIR